MKKQKKDKSPYFPALVEHIDTSWKKLKGFGYPFQGKDFRYLKTYCRSFQEWGVMALWDVFLASDSDWVKKTGYSLDGFFRCLPWLVDDRGWKSKAAEYEKKLVPPAPKEIASLFEVIEPRNALKEIAKERKEKESMAAREAVK